MTKYIEFRNRILCYIIVFATIWGSKLPGINFFGFTLYPIRLILVIWVLYMLLNIIHKSNKKIFLRKNILFLLLFLLYGFISIAWSCNVNSTITTLIIYITSIFVYIFFSNEWHTDNEKQYMCEGFYVNMIIMALIAINESFTGQYNNLSYDYYLSTYNILGLYRPLGAFYNTNDLSTFFILSFPIAIYATKKWKHNNFWGLLLAFITFFIILLTGSRAGLIGVFAFCGFYLIYQVKLFNGSKKLISLIILFLALIIGLYFLPTMKTSLLLDNNIASEDRIPIWLATFQNCKNYYFLGSGLGTSAFLSGSLGLTHNYTLEILCESGFFGVIIIFYVLKESFPKLTQIKKNKRLVYFRIWFYICIIASICVSTMLGCYYIWAILGIGNSLKNNQLHNHEKKKGNNLYAK